MTEVKPDRIVFVRACAICGKDISRNHPKAWIGAQYKDSHHVTAPVHATCARDVLSDSAKSMIDPEKIVSDADRSEE